MTSRCGGSSVKKHKPYCSCNVYSGSYLLPRPLDRHNASLPHVPGRTLNPFCCTSARYPVHPRLPVPWV
jgi:hypothetical protein